MLFISLLLSVWFGLWLMFAMRAKDVYKTFMQLIETFDEDEEEEEEICSLIQNSQGEVAYHLYCEKCNYDWWTTKADTNYCPNCGLKRKENNYENIRTGK